MKKHAHIFFTKVNAILVCIVLGIIFFEQNATLVEKYYYSSFYPISSNFQRLIFNIFPFSIGDCLCAIAVLFFSYKIISMALAIGKVDNKKIFLLQKLNKLFQLLLCIFIAFKMLWAINYNRLGITYQFKIKEQASNTNELQNFIEKGIENANNLRRQIVDTNLPNINIDSCFAETEQCYFAIKKYYPFLQVNHFGIKKNLLNSLGNSFGYTGYYNPFTGEAQVRTDIPSIMLPFICCHEVAHQIGYASEDEANFIASIVANESHNIYFKYSLQLELLDYAFYELMLQYIYKNNLEQWKKEKFRLIDCLSTQVKKDRKAIKLFFQKNKNQISAVSNVVYDKYLKLNQQQQGIESYNNVVNWLISYSSKLSK